MPGRPPRSSPPSRKTLGRIQINVADAARGERVLPAGEFFVLHPAMRLMFFAVPQFAARSAL